MVEIKNGFIHCNQYKYLLKVTVTVKIIVTLMLIVTET